MNRVTDRVLPESFTTDNILFTNAYLLIYLSVDDGQVLDQGVKFEKTDTSHGPSGAPGTRRPTTEVLARRCFEARSLREALGLTPEGSTQGAPVRPPRPRQELGARVAQGRPSDAVASAPLRPPGPAPHVPCAVVLSRPQRRVPPRVEEAPRPTCRGTGIARSTTGPEVPTGEGPTVEPHPSRAVPPSTRTVPCVTRPQPSLRPSVERAPDPVGDSGAGTSVAVHAAPAPVPPPPPRRALAEPRSP